MYLTTTKKVLRSPRCKIQSILMALLAAILMTSGQPITHQLAPSSVTSHADTKPFSQLTPTYGDTRELESIPREIEQKGNGNSPSSHNGWHSAALPQLDSVLLWRRYSRLVGDSALVGDKSAVISAPTAEQRSRTKPTHRHRKKRSAVICFFHCAECNKMYGAAAYNAPRCARHCTLSGGRSADVDCSNVTFWN
ncbi:PREDICTED: uncharacterized protein LOC106809699 [Priapulus caudatus]|uniref:Uncharacterized protein LOC106809699 n=1 Tax=Priapulus caudatus TaxID=37621 RepID=A0ABM1E837_PRICU|nr:PREDICTED: uncharacterized protein LOC106809699 [Priapulus caudatus]